ncbi:hypothetical protein GCM10009798_32510 [Nocardioides panacihumi]|uniref:ATP-grasp domain-containing protein n=1 Tax=Nocardioides panacihumi TaxID=400774 RepID=A0ABP5CW44_9ACTN
MAVVLVGFAESLAAIETIWDLLDSGHDVRAFSRGGRTPPIGHDRRVRVTPVTPPERDVDATIRDVVRLADRLGGPVCMPLDDAAVLVLDRVAAERPDLVVAGPVRAQARLALDKRVQLDAAARAGLLVPATLVVEPGSTPGLPPGPPPWIVKPALALEVVGGRVTKGGARFVATLDELHEELGSRHDTVLVQPALRGGGIGVFGVAVSGSALAVSGHERVRMMNPSGSGSSACVSREPAATMREAADTFVGIVGWQGLFMLELLEDADRQAWFMELNGRPWGSMALATARGLHYPSWTVAAALGRPVDVGPSPDTRPVLARHLGREALHLAFVVRGRIEARRRSRHGLSPRPDLALYPTVLTTLRSLLTWSRGSRLYNARRRRLRVLAADTLATLRDAIPARGR